MGRDHALSGGLAFAAVAPLLHPTVPALAAGVVLTAGAALLPDFDEPHSTIARTAGFLTGGFARLVRLVSGGHRKGSHSVVGLAVFTAAAWAAVRYDGSMYGKVALGVFLALLLAAAFRALHIGGHHGDALGMAAAAAMVYWRTGLSLVALCIALGAAAHVAGDMCTDDGVPFLYPLSGHDFHALPVPMCFKTGKAVEHWLVSPLLLAALGFLLWRDTGAMTFATHARTAIGAP